MKKILYAKYNRVRRPEFQTSTKIVQEHDRKYTEKEALTEQSIEHICSFERKYTAIQELYKNAIPCNVIVKDNIAKFDFISGETVAELIENKMYSLDSVMKELKKYVELIFAYNEAKMSSFSMSENFKKVFGDFPELDGCLAVTGMDVDAILDNFIIIDNKLVVIDYEWYFDFLIPVDYVKFRCLFYFYSKNHSFFDNKITISDFLKEFDIDYSKVDLFKEMDDRFQQYVHGENRECIYTWNYQQANRDINGLLNRWSDVEGEIAKRDQKAIELSELVKKNENEIQILNETITQLRNELQTTEYKLNHYIASYNQIVNSLSWRMTQPVRLALNVPGCIKEHGLRYTVRHALSKGKKSVEEEKKVVSEKCYDEDTILTQRNTKFAYRPKFSILVPLYNTPEKFLREMIDSVMNQTYDNWELCLADGSDAEHKEVEKICRSYKEERIVYKRLEKNGGISENTNECIKIASGDYIGLFDHDDLLDITALYEITKKLNEDRTIDVLYTDEDKVFTDESGNKRFAEPHFKSDFNLDLFRTNNYICHFFVAKREIVDRVEGFRKEYDGSQDFDFILRCIENSKKVCHIPKILYHWRIHENSTAANPESKMYCYESGKKAIEDHLKRSGVNATVEMTEHLGFYRVKYKLQKDSKISIIIPNKDEKETLRKCINSIKTKTTYSNYEIIVVENNSNTQEIFEYYKELEQDGIKVVTWKHEFNYSKINNFGVKYATGDYYLLLNNDVEVITSDWLEELLSNCQRSEVGIVGAKLLYPDDTIQHNGVIIGLGGIAGHSFCGLPANHPGYFGRAFIQQNLNAVTAACLMVSKELYHEVDGLEEKLQVAFNDVDFCLKVREKGYLVVLNPNVQLYHYESKSRGLEDTDEKKARFQSEVDYMAERWEKVLTNGDEYYNPNLSLVVPFQPN